MATLSNLVVMLGLNPKQFNKELASSSAKLNKWGKDFRKVGAGMTAAFTVPAIAAGGALLKIGSDYDSMADTIRTATGATGAELQALNDDALAVFKTIPTTMNDAGTATAAYSSQLGLTGTQLQDVTRAGLELARITDTDLNTVLDESTDLLASWNIAGEDQVATMDKILRASQASGVGVDELMKGVIDAGPTFRNLGLDIDQAIALVAAFGKAGLDSTMVINAMKKAVVTFANEGITDTGAALKSTFDQIVAAPDSITAAGIAMEVFGTKAGPQLADAIRSGTVSYDDLLQAVSGGTDTINSAAADTNDLAEKWQIFKNRITVAVLPAANQLFDWVNAKGIPMLDDFAGRVETLIEWFTGLESWQKKLIVGFGLVLAALGPVLIVLGYMASGLSVLIPLFGAVAAAATSGAVATAAAWAIAFWPITLAIVLIAAFVLAYKKNWLGIADITDRAVGWVVDAIQPVLDVIVLLGTYWKQVATNEIQPGNLAKLPGWLRPIALVLGRIIKTLRVFVKTWQDKGFIAALQTIPKQIRAFGRAVAGLLDSLGLARFARAWKETFYAASHVVEDVIALIDDLVHGRWSEVIGDLGAIARDGLKLLWSVLKGIPALWRDVFEIVGPLLVKLSEWSMRMLLSGLSTGWSSYLKPFLSKLPGYMVDLLAAGYNLFHNIGNYLLGALGAGITAGWQWLVGWFKDLPQRLVDMFASAYNAYYNIGNYIISGLAAGIGSAWNWMVGWLQDKWNALPGYLRKLWEIASPSKVFAEIGQNAIMGLQQGLSSAMPGISATISMAGAAGASGAAGMVSPGGITGPVEAGPGGALNVNFYGDITTQATNGQQLWQELMSEVQRVRTGSA